MNRAQRRHAANHCLAPAEHLTQEEFNQKVRQEAEKISGIYLQKKIDQVLMETLESSMAATCAVLHCGFGFGAKRLQRFVGEYNGLFDRILAEEISLNQLKAAALKLGVNLSKSSEQVNNTLALKEEEA